MFSKELALTFYSLESKKIKGKIRIAHLSDLHDTLYGEGQSALVECVESALPDIVVYSGDMTEHYSDHKNAEILMSALSKKYPSFYSIGNHELRGDYEGIKAFVSSLGVTALDGKAQLVSVGGDKIAVCGVDDPSNGGIIIKNDKNPITWQSEIEACERALLEYGEVYSVLLSHRPDLVKKYKKMKFDLILSGHAHGGQVAFPFLKNGIYAPEQGFFPKYTNGVYDLGYNKMIVSRGLCKNALPRIYNRPEVVIIDIYSSKKEGDRK